VLIAQAVFLLECGQHTDATEYSTHDGGYTAGVGNDKMSVHRLSTIFPL